MELSGRKKDILKAVIKEYIITAEPIGSRTISKRYILNVSSATIRNEMADLEELGYLKQPHTSAGRVPSDKGYRFYVDSLMDIQEVPKGMERMIKEKYLSKKQNIEELIKATSSILSNLTRYTALVAGPKFNESVLRNLQLIPIEGERVLIIVVTGSGLIHQERVKLSTSLNREELESIGRFINERLYGQDLLSIDSGVFKEIEKELENIAFYKSLLQAVQEAVSKDLVQDWEQVYVEGTSNILDQPEFSDLEKVKVVLRLFEQKELLKRLLNDLPPSDLKIIIGQENPLEEIKNCSLVTADYSYKGQTFGKIAILGPTRMEYPKVASMVKFMAQVLSKVLYEED